MSTTSLRFQRNILFSLFICLILPLTIYAADDQNSRPEGKNALFFVKEFGLFSGYANGELKDKDDYNLIPGIVRLGYNLNSLGLGFTDLLKPVFDRLNIKSKGYTEFILEPFINTVISPDSNVEAGCAIFLKFAYPLTDRFHPYGIAGGGIIYMSQHTNEQSTQYNFVPQVGVGFSYFLKDNCAFNVEYRYRHLSNAMLKRPNDGINIDMILIGISWFH